MSDSILQELALRPLDQGSPSQPDASGDDFPPGLTRRELLLICAGALVAAGTNACSSPDHNDQRSTLIMLRAEDLLALRVQLNNLHIEPRSRQPSRLIRTRFNTPAGVTIVLPGQHIAETAYRGQVDDPAVHLPAASFLSGTSQLTFQLPEHVDDIELTLDAILNSDTWETESSESSIEMPAGLTLSPANPALWTHAHRPVTYNSRTEIWHSYLRPLNDASLLGMTISAPAQTSAALDALTTSLNKKERDHLASNSRQAEARLVVLSAMGGWLDITGDWSDDPVITRWEHRATAGQDQHVLVERAAGRLLPFGHAAALIKVTDRELNAAMAGDQTANTAAVLRQRFFIIIKDPVQVFAAGDMPFQRLTATELVSPPLAEEPPSDGPFWVKTATEDPYPFPFTGTDWARGTQHFAAPAVFVPIAEDYEAALARYRQWPEHQFAELHGAATVVAPFLPAANPALNAWDEPLQKTRTEGDTQLLLLQLRFDARATPEQEQPFQCTLTAMEAALPSLQAYLPTEINRGWFELLDPDALDNRGEVFAQALLGQQKIPMAFENQSDRSGCLATPSFTVDGISRTLGPIGNAKAIRTGDPIDFASYFTGAASLLGGFNLAQLLPKQLSGTSPAVPTIEFAVTRKIPEEKDDDEKVEGDKPASLPPPEVSLGLSWQTGLGELKLGLISFLPRLDNNNQSLARLSLKAKMIKSLGESHKAPQSSSAISDTDSAGNSEDVTDADAEGGNPAPSSGVTWQVSGKVSNFTLRLSAFDAAGFDVEFDYLGVKLAPVPPKAASENDPIPSPPTDEGDSEVETEDKNEPLVKSEIEYRITRVNSFGLLGFINPLIAMAQHLPKIPDLDSGPPSASYPAKLPGADSADLSVIVGPIEVPKFELVGFEVSQASATVGIGLNFYPQPGKSSSDSVVPPNIFTLAVASADKPARVISGRWGGLTHIGASFTIQRLVGFQFGFGLLYRAKFNLGVTTAKCEVSVSATFTYKYKNGDEDLVQLAFIIQLSGEARVYGAIDIYLGFVAIAAYEDASSAWEFAVDLTVRVKIAFFSVSATFRFQHRIRSDQDSSGLLANARTRSSELSREAWLQYRQAFAGAAD